MTREGERELVKVEHVNGGDGYIVREAMVTSEEAAGGRFSVLIIMNGIHPAAGHYPLDS